MKLNPFKRKRRRKSLSITLVPNSPLRALDPRAKLFLCLMLSMTVMTPLIKVVISLCIFLAIMVYAQLIKQTIEQIRRIWFILVVLFIVDWIFVSHELAVIIVLRISMMVGIFTIFFSTTTSTEMAVALEKLGVSYRYSFSLSLAFQSINILGDEWRTILEAQKARGIDLNVNFWRQLRELLHRLVALTVPAIVLTTRRAWAVTEAAHARGYDSPKRFSYNNLSMKSVDWIVIALIAAYVMILFLLPIGTPI